MQNGEKSTMLAEIVKKKKRTDSPHVIYMEIYTYWRDKSHLFAFVKF